MNPQNQLLNEQIFFGTFYILSLTLFIIHPKVNLQHLYCLQLDDKVIGNESLNQRYCLFLRIVTHHLLCFQIQNSPTYKVSPGDK